jgi:lipopolysaccharide export system permease protein
MTLDRYLIRQILLYCGAVTLVLLLIVLGTRLATYLGEAVAGRIPAGAVLDLLIARLPGIFTLLLPAAMFFALMLLFGRLREEQELTALLACGVGPVRLYRPLVIVAAPFLILLTALAFWIAPSAADHWYQLRTRAQHEAVLALFSAGRFQAAAQDGVTFFAERGGERPDVMHGVFIHVLRDGRAQLHVAREARLSDREGNQDTDGLPRLVLEAGRVYDGVPGAGDWRVMQFARETLRLPGDTAAPRRKREATPSAALWASDKVEDAAEWHWRLAAPVGGLLLMLLAVPLALGEQRRGRSLKLVAALGVFVAYINLLSAGQVWLRAGKVPAVLGLWWVHALLLLLGLVLLWRRSRLPAPRPA